MFLKPFGLLMRQDKVQKIKNLKQQIAAVHSETGKLKEVPSIWCWWEKGVDDAGGYACVV